MKIYAFGDENKPVILLIPGTCCEWKIFEPVIPRLTKSFRVECVSFSGFDETEDSSFVSVLDETEKIEDYIRKAHGGEICAVYGCSLGGTLAMLLTARARVIIRYAIIGSSDFDTDGKLAAKLKTKMVLGMIYPLINTGEPQGLMKKLMAKRMDPNDKYMTAMMQMFGMGTARPYISRESIAKQFYTDLITVLPDGTDNPNTEIHVLYAKKMGEKYLARYKKYIKNPIIHEDDLQHEELLVCYPEQWAERIESICLSGEKYS